MQTNDSSDISESDESLSKVEGKGDAEDTIQKVDNEVNSDYHSDVVIEDNELAKEQIEKDIADFEELKARIYLLEIHLRQIAKYNSLKENKEFVEDIDITLKHIDFKVINLQKRN
jgi:hypothetical protein